MVLGDGHFELHNVADAGGFNAVDGEPEGFLEERIFNIGGLAFERDDAAFAGDAGVFDDLLDDGVHHRDGREKDRGQAAEGAHRDVERRGDHDGADSASEDDHGRGDLGDVFGIAVLHHEAGADAAESQQEAENGGEIRAGRGLLFGLRALAFFSFLFSGFGVCFQP